MNDTKKYKCVNCGTPAAALYRTYGPTVVKLAKCEKCKKLVDKYVEYDPVIVMIDIMLMAKEAQRHLLYNTEFKSYWKLFIILMMLETYGVWRNDSLFNIAVNSMCGFKTHSSVNTTRLGIPINIEVPDSWKVSCWAWNQEERGDDNDLFIWEKDFYIQFISTFSGIVVFILLINNLLKILKMFAPVNEVNLLSLLKAFSLGNASVLFLLPMLVWGQLDASPETRAVHYAIVYAYSLTMFTGVFTVLYEYPEPAVALVVITASIAKQVTCYQVAPYLRQIIA